MSQPFKDPPDQVNSIGVKLWHDTTSSEYACKDEHLASGGVKKGLYRHSVWYAELPDGERAIILVNDKGNPIYESKQLDAMGAHIDMLKLAKHLTQ